MLEMVEDGFINEWSQIYLNHTTGIGKTWISLQLDKKAMLKLLDF